MFPTARLVIYHSAFEHGLSAGGTTEPADPASATNLACGPMAVQRAGGMFPEGPYDESNAMTIERGVNSLIKSLRDNNIGPNGTKLDPTTKEIIPGTENSTWVYAECGGTWPNLMTGRVDEAMHYWGKLLKHIGEDRIVWGTDCLWFGSPQPVIEGFRCFQISDAFQMMYGYPALTQAKKAKILGINARDLQNIRRPNNPITACRHSDIVTASARQLRRELDEEFGRRRDMIKHVWAPRTRREFLALRAAENREKLHWSGRSPSRGWNGKV
jgi:hypothetical protein